MAKGLVEPSGPPGSGYGAPTRLDFGVADASPTPKPGPPAVLFLDVDGVLHPAQARHPRQQFLPSCLELLSEVLRATGASVVLSTAWRLDPLSRQTVEDKLRQHGLPAPIGRTPNLDMFRRSREILTWVNRHKPAKWVAVDDWPLLEETRELAGHFVQTRPRIGLSRDTADHIMTLFRQQTVSAY